MVLYCIIIFLFFNFFFALEEIDLVVKYLIYLNFLYIFIYFYIFLYIFIYFYTKKKFYWFNLFNNYKIYTIFNFYFFYIKQLISRIFLIKNSYKLLLKFFFWRPIFKRNSYLNIFYVNLNKWNLTKFK